MSFFFVFRYAFALVTCFLSSDFLSAETADETGAETPTCDETAVFYTSVLPPGDFNFISIASIRALTGSKYGSTLSRLKSNKSS